MTGIHAYEAAKALMAQGEAFFAQGQDTSAIGYWKLTTKIIGACNSLGPTDQTQPKHDVLNLHVDVQCCLSNVLRATGTPNGFVQAIHEADLLTQDHSLTPPMKCRLMLCKVDGLVCVYSPLSFLDIYPLPVSPIYKSVLLTSARSP